MAGIQRNAKLKPIDGTGLKVLFINDEPITKRIFERWIKGAKFVSSSSTENAIERLVKGKERFNAVLIDKNLGHFGRYEGAQQAVNAIQRLSPWSHICIHSAETGPGKFKAQFPFISIQHNSAVFVKAALKFFSAVKKQPFLKKPERIDLSALKRPIPVLTREGTIKVFYVIEGDPPSKELLKLTHSGGRGLTIGQALEMTDRIRSAKDRSALISERTRVKRFQRKVKAAIHATKSSSSTLRSRVRRRCP